MPFAVVGYFDQETDCRVKAIWKDFADSGVSDYLHKSANDPHFKFAMFDTMNVEDARKTLVGFTQRFNKLELHFKNYGMYPGDKPMLFLDIAVTVPILEMQSEVKEIFAKCGAATDFNYFEQGIWKPDIVLANEVNKAKLDWAIKLFMRGAFTL
ncbi:hypothetical protein [Paenibacillus sp. IHBB 3054]|uniref:hypothetical protein n=1 Tax=Paenibacillus sp. IHBB 3054 TaxID=3425689 RepID=UPI003F66FDFD